MQLIHHTRARLVPDLKLTIVEVECGSCGLVEVAPALKSRWTVARTKRAGHRQLTILSNGRRILHRNIGDLLALDVKPWPVDDPLMDYLLEYFFGEGSRRTSIAAEPKVARKVGLVLLEVFVVAP